MSKEKILLDVDEVICFSGYLEAVNEFLNTNYVIDDFTEYYIDAKAIPKDRFDEFNIFMKERDLYKDAVFLPNSIESIKELNNLYDIYICSACINHFDVDNSGIAFLNKFNFLRKNLRFIDPEKIILTNAKGIINTDIQIDDRLDNLNSNAKLKILFPSYHNKEITNEKLIEKNVVRAGYDYHEGWNNVLDILEEKRLIKK